jgi:Glycolipid 2-alpha-mannosyltransferase
VTAYKRKLALKSRGLWEMFLDQPYFNESQDIENIPDGRWGQADVSDAEPDGMEGETYNRCHFWSNFEIARLGFFRSQEYEGLFEMLDRSGGFWSERVCRIPRFSKHFLLLFVPVSIKGLTWGVVGGRPNSLAGRGNVPNPQPNPLLPRHRLPTLRHSPLSR